MKFLDIELNAWAKAGSQEEFIPVVPAKEKWAGSTSKAYGSRKRKQAQQVVQLSLFSK